MAFVSEFVQTVSEPTGRKHSTCTCGWKVARRDGAVVLQLDTYGSPARQDRGTVSQSIQLDERSARELVSIIRDVFPGV